MKRFYKTARVARTPQGSWQIILDGKALRTPQDRALAPSAANLAAAIAAEWNIQGDIIDMKTMPLTRLTAGAIDRVAPSRQEIIQDLVNRIETDLLRHRSASPQALHDRQLTLWQPLLDWMENTIGIKLIPVEGVMSRPVSQDHKDFLGGILQRYDDFELLGLTQASKISGSVVVALALLTGRLDSESAYNISLLEELWQIETWGEDPEASARRTAVKSDLNEIAHFLKLIRS
jgi:chaperone required for assembly of F1-ATPase